MKIYGIQRFFEDNFEILCSPFGIVLVLCTVICMAIAVFTYPKYHKKAFFIFMLFIILALSFCITYDYADYYKDLNRPDGPNLLTILIQHTIIVFFCLPFLLVFCVGHLPFFALFYWVSIGIIVLLSRKKTISNKDKVGLILVISILVLLFTKLWNDAAFMISGSVLGLLIYMLFF